MKPTVLKYLLSGALLALAASQPLQAEKLVLLTTNDTHSQIDPDTKDNMGGAARRKVVVDSVRSTADNMLLVDAGDAVQGTLYFNLFGGEVEQKVMNALGYDLRILGNHEFDNGIDTLAAVLALADAEFLATNYDLSHTPLNNEFDKYTTRRFGDKKIGFIGINLRPEGMISEGNYDGLRYLDAMEAANASAWWLKNIDTCDMVVAITHIGYAPSVPPGDLSLAQASDNIDIIIGGHSHDLIDPSKDTYKWLVPNKNGKNVLITQNGKQGKYVGEITIDLDSLTTDYRLIPIDKRLDNRIDPAIADLIAGYRAGVDSLMQVPVGRTAIELPQTSAELLNWATDIVLARGRELADDVDFAILNKGGLRRGLPKGTITKGEIMTMLPFNNRIDIIDIKGSDLIPAFEQMARIGGNGVSEGVEITYEADDDDKDPEIESITINGKPFDIATTYRVATIDYLAKGGDYMPSLAKGKPVVESQTVLYNDVLDYLKQLRNRKIRPSGEVRFKKI